MVRRLSLGDNALYKSMIHKKERELVKSYLSAFREELKGVQEFDESLRKNYKWVELRAKIQLCERLLGKR